MRNIYTSFQADLYRPGNGARRNTTNFRIMLHHNKLYHFHGSLRTCGRGIANKHCANSFNYRINVIFTQMIFLSEIDINTTKETIQTVLDEIPRIIKPFGNLDTLNANWVN